jgi:hypothetical protein
MRNRIGRGSNVAENRKQNPKPPPDDAAQSKRFIEDAKQLEVEETGELFEKTFGVVTSSTPRADLPRPEDKV